MAPCLQGATQARRVQEAGSPRHRAGGLVRAAHGYEPAQDAAAAKRSETRNGGGPMSAYVELSKLTKIYPTPNGPAVIVKDFDLTIQQGEFVTLIGHSGCGKS